MTSPASDFIAPGDPVLHGSGLRWLPVAHTGNRTSSVEEAAVVADLVQRALGAEWVDQTGRRRAVTPADVLVVAPYNAHVDILAEHLPDGVTVGTVDRIQGHQAAVVIASLGASSADDVPRGLEFLYSRNRLNVAVSSTHVRWPCWSPAPTCSVPAATPWRRSSSSTGSAAASDWPPRPHPRPDPRRGRP